eukprot:8353326-Pyramimonas_sp.AAC.1
MTLHASLDARGSKLLPRASPQPRSRRKWGGARPGHDAPTAGREEQPARQSPEIQARSLLFP